MAMKFSLYFKSSYFLRCVFFFSVFCFLSLLLCFLHIIQTARVFTLCICARFLLYSIHAKSSYFTRFFLSSCSFFGFSCCFFFSSLGDLFHRFFFCYCYCDFFEIVDEMHICSALILIFMRSRPQ